MTKRGFRDMIYDIIAELVEENNPPLPEEITNYTYSYAKYSINWYNLRKYLKSLKKTGKVVLIISTGNFVMFDLNELFLGGDTYPYRKQIKVNGFEWNPGYYMWMYTHALCVDELLEKIEWVIANLPIDVVVVFTHPDSAYVLPAKQFLEAIREKLSSKLNNTR